MRGVTRVTESVPARLHISIHTPHAGSDPPAPDQRTIKSISIHTPHAGSDDYPNDGSGD